MPDTLAAAQKKIWRERPRAERMEMSLAIMLSCWPR